eukprot:XP_014781411.1 PREDICTED: E3 ubiquitin-protein ligase complex slx8-rfp subunit slx8-like isoform X2 [Octopus bimaculoides]
MPNFGSRYTANRMESTCNIHDMSCFISDVVSAEPITICDNPRRIARDAVYTHRTAGTKRLRKQNRLKSNNIGNSASDPILIPDEPIIESRSFRKNVPSTSETESESHRTSPASQICPLCLETFENIRSKNIKFRATLCGHIFCEMCLAKCPTLNYKCPVCRKPVKPKQLIHLFL